MSSSWSGQKKRSPVCVTALAKNAKTSTDHNTSGVAKQLSSSATDTPAHRKKAQSRDSRSPNRPQRHSPAPQRKSPRTTKRGRLAAVEQPVQEEGKLNAGTSGSLKSSRRRAAVAGNENDRVNDMKGDTGDVEVTDDEEKHEAKKSLDDRIIYTRDELMRLRRCDISNEKHEDLDEKFVVGNKWNPDLWHQSFSPEQEETKTGYTKKSDGDIVLGPRAGSLSFSCSQPGRREDSEDSNESNVDLRPRMGKSQTFRSSHRTGYENGSGLEWRRGRQLSDIDGRDGRGNRRRDADDGDWQTDSKRRPRLNSHSKGSNNCEPNDWSEEEEPEWMTHGPTSQLEFIELRGFDDEEERRQMVDGNEGKQNQTDDGEQGKEETNSHDETDSGAIEEQLTESSGFDFDDFLKSSSTFTNTQDAVPDLSFNTELNSSRFRRYFTMGEHSPSFEAKPLANHLLRSHTGGEGLAPGVAALFQSASSSSTRAIPQSALTEDELRRSERGVDAAMGQMLNKMGMLSCDMNEGERVRGVRMGDRNYTGHADRKLEASPDMDGDVEVKHRDKTSPQPRVPAAFLPTAVIRKMHNEGRLQPGLLNDKVKAESCQTKHADSLSPTSLSDVPDSRLRVLQEHQMRQQELLWQQQRARQEFILQRQILHEQQIGRQRELQRRALLEAENRRRAQILTLRKFAIDRGLPPETDPRIVYHLFQQYHLQRMRQVQLRQLQQQRSLSPGSAGYATQNIVAQQMARAGVRGSSGGQSAPFHGAAGGDALALRAKLSDQAAGGKSPGRNSPVSFTGTPPPSLRPIPHHPLQQLTHEQLLAAHRARLMQTAKDSETAAATLAKWFGPQHALNSSDGKKGAERMLSVEDLEEKDSD